MMKMNMNWISRHELNNGQKSCIDLFAQTRDGISKYSVKSHNIIFSDNPLRDLLENGISKGDILLGVFPIPIFVTLLKAGYTVGVFQNMPSTRQKGVFTCKDLSVYRLDQVIGNIETEVIPCPLSIEDQEESELTPIER